MIYKEKVNYFFCPDPKCKGFRTKVLLCNNGKCLKVDKLRIGIICWNCKRLIHLPGNHCSFCRVDCACGASIFDRMSGKYQLVRSKNGKRKRKR